MIGAQGPGAGRDANGRNRGRRARRGLIGAAALILLVAAPLSIERFGSIDLAAAAVQRAKSFLELIQQRSPGLRTHGELIKTKRKKKTVLHERALPKVRMATPILPPGSPTALIDLVAPPVPIIPASFDVIPISPLSPPPSAPPIIPFSSPPGVVGPPETPFTPPIIPPPPVPEPQTWSTMLLGFGLVGWMLRRRRKNGLVLS